MDSSTAAIRLEKLLDNIPDCYPGFSKMILFSCGKTPELCGGLAAFVENNPNARAAEVTAKLNDMKARFDEEKHR